MLSLIESVFPWDGLDFKEQRNRLKLTKGKEKNDGFLQLQGPTMLIYSLKNKNSKAGRNITITFNRDIFNHATTVIDIFDALHALTVLTL